MHDDTIAAIATPLGEGALAVIRISGRDACAVGDRVFTPAGRHPASLAQVPSHTIHYGHVVRDGRRIDEVLVSVMRAPRTFTREDVVEIACHGGVLATRLVLGAVLAAGARSAEPGEFTQRAFLNGRIDLTQAEAVADVIHARTELALQSAEEQLAGHLARRIHLLRDDLMNVLAHVEAHIDFPDEDIDPATQTELLRRLRGARQFVDELLATARDGRILRHGVRVAIVGRPNTGKSSLLNQLLGHDRAIVSPVAGTTRDTIEETASIRGLPVHFVDTAGLRESEDAIEVEGMRRSRQMMARAELVLVVWDASEPLQASAVAEWESLAGRPRLLVVNKTDLPRALEMPPGWASIEVSCRTGRGLEELRDAMQKLICGGAMRTDMAQATINARHQEALRRARESLERSIGSLEGGQPLELTALDVRQAAQAVGEVVGKTTTEDLLDSIFSTFCLGK